MNVECLLQEKLKFLVQLLAELLIIICLHSAWGERLSKGINVQITVCILAMEVIEFSPVFVILSFIVWERSVMNLTLTILAYLSHHIYNKCMLILMPFSYFWTLFFFGITLFLMGKKTETHCQLQSCFIFSLNRFLCMVFKILHAYGIMKLNRFSYTMYFLNRHLYFQIINML